MSIQLTLMAWSRGKAIDDAPNGIRPPAWTKSIRNPGTANLSIPPLPDDEMMRVDYAISAMKHRKPKHHSVIVLYYLEHKGDKEVARRIRGSRTMARELRIAAEHYLEAKLD